MIHICHRHHRWKGQRKPVNINGINIPDVKVAKILGVTIDSSWKFQKHFRETIQSMKNRVNLLRAISFRANRTTLRRIGEAVCLSKLLYGIELFGTKCIKPYNKVYNKILRIVTGAFCTTPGLTTAIEAGVLSFDGKVVETLVRRYCKLAEKPNTTITILEAEAKEVFTAMTGSNIPDIEKLLWVGCRSWNKSVPSVDWSVRNITDKSETPTVNRMKALSIIEQKYNDHHKLYSDGSKAGRLVGIGVVGPNTTVNNQLPRACSVFTAEAAALSVAIDHTHHSPTVIFSDSASCLSAIVKGSLNHPFLQLVEQKMRNKPIVLCWIPSHVGISGNEAADRAANLGRNSEFLTSNIPAIDAIREVRKQIWRSHQHKWDSEQHHVLKTIKPTVYKWNDRPRREEQRILSRCRLNHTRLTKQSLLQNKNVSNCDTCEAVLDVKHIVIDCPNFKVARNKFKISERFDVALSNDRREEN